MLIFPSLPIHYTNICVEMGGICITAELQKHKNR